MKSIFRLLIGLALLVPSASIAQRTVLNFNREWTFCLGDTTNGEWRQVNLPHDFQIETPWVAPVQSESFETDNAIATVKSRLSARGFKEMGTGWYKKTFIAPQQWSDRRVVIDFEGLMLVGDVWLNGKLIASTDYGYLGFDVDISTLLHFGAENVILVKSDTGNPENSRWYTGGGLFRDVNLILTDSRRHFARHPLAITTPQIDSDHALVVVGGEIVTFESADSIEVGIEVLDQNGVSLYADRKRHRNNRRQKVREYQLDSISIENPNLWNIETPYLYTLKATLYRPDGTPADEVTEKFGIRSLAFTPDSGLILNGRKVLLKGIANHHTLGALGAAVYPRAMEKRIQLLKEFGVNHIRTSHNPYSESFLDLCDENGILVVDELYDKWTTKYSGGRREWNNLWVDNIPEWVRRDRNHPSVVVWSLGNELQMLTDMPYNDWGVTAFELQKTLLKRYDQERPVTVAMHPRFRNEFTDSLPAPLVLHTDIASYNYRYMYFPGDGQRFKNLIFYQSEASVTGMPGNFFGMNRDKVLGLAYWGAIDYLGESGGWPAKGWVQGVFDISLRPKPQAYLMKSMFKPDEPMVYIGIVEEEDTTVWNGVRTGTDKLTSHWNRCQGSLQTVHTYTNADEVELLLNGISLGRRVNNTNDPSGRNRIVWADVPYKKGKLEARAYNNGTESPVATYAVSTAGRAVKLKALTDNENWKADGIDLQHISIESVDNKGRVDPTCNTLLQFEVVGEAEIVGVVNGDMYSDESMVGNCRSLFRGAVTVILRSTDNSGEATLRISGEGFKALTIRMKTI